MIHKRNILPMLSHLKLTPSFYITSLFFSIPQDKIKIKF